VGTAAVRSTFGRSITAFVVIVMAIGMMSASAGADEVDPVDGPAPSAVTITQTPSGGGGLCVPPPLGLTYTTANTPESFTLRVVAASAPCTPIEAKAVIYAMPDGATPGNEWPQTLVEAVPFTISEAGVTEIVFAKDCDPVQFDVLTGATPQVISPTGEWHGPLLFPLDTATSLQWFGTPGCTPATTTTTTTIPEVDSVTTVPADTPTTQPEVAGATTVPPQGSATTERPTAAPAELALTGTGSAWAAATGVALVLAGAAMLFAARRRNPADAA
jgi:LPXTG-motif cell wall-anchored protein